ncbi:MAG: hypothetical protein Q9165_004447 [Trypethelium subeluteriae]
MAAKKGDINPNGHSPNESYVSQQDQKLEGAYIHGHFVPPITVSPSLKTRGDDSKGDAHTLFNCPGTHGLKKISFDHRQYELAAARAIRIIIGAEDTISYGQITYPDHVLGPGGNNYLGTVQFDGKDALPSICQDRNAYAYQFPILNSETPGYVPWDGRSDPGVYRVIIASTKRMGSDWLGGLLATADDISFCTITQPMDQQTFTSCSPAPGDIDTPEWQALMKQTNEQFEIQPVYRLLRKDRAPLVDYAPRGEVVPPTPPKRRIRNRKRNATSEKATILYDISPRVDHSEPQREYSAQGSNVAVESSGNIISPLPLHRSERLNASTEKISPPSNEDGRSDVNEVSICQHNAERDGLVRGVGQDNADHGGLDQDGPGDDHIDLEMDGGNMAVSTTEASRPLLASDERRGHGKTQLFSRCSGDPKLSDGPGNEANMDESGSRPKDVIPTYGGRRPLSPSAETPQAKRSRTGNHTDGGLFVHSSDYSEENLRQADIIQSAENDTSQQRINVPDSFETRPASEQFVPRMDPSDPLWFKKYAAWAKMRKEAVACAAVARASQQDGQSGTKAVSYKISEHMHKLCSCMNFCGRPDEAEDMVKCDTPGHENRWYHLSCAELTEAPEEDEPWYCPDCTNNTADDSSLYPVFSRHPTSAIRPSHPSAADELSPITIKERGLRSWTPGWSIREEQAILDIMQDLIDANENQSAADASREADSSEREEQQQEQEQEEAEEEEEYHTGQTRTYPKLTGRFRNLDALFTHISDELWSRYGYERTRAGIRARWDGADGLRSRAEAAWNAEQRHAQRQADGHFEAARQGVSLQKVVGVTGSAGGVKRGGPIVEGMAPEFRSIRGIRDLDRRVKALVESKGVRGGGPGQMRERKKVGRRVVEETEETASDQMPELDDDDEDLDGGAEHGEYEEGGGNGEDEEMIEEDDENDPDYSRK